MSDTTPQDAAAMSPASTGSLANAHSARQDAEAKIIADGIAEIIRIASEPDWISVGERLPGKRCRVLVLWRLTGHITIAWFRPDKKRKRFLYEVDGFNELKDTQAYITHWMPLPAPPTDAK